MERRDFIKTGIGFGTLAGLMANPVALLGIDSADDVRQIVIRTSWCNTNIGEIANLQAALNLFQRGLPRAKIYFWPAAKNDAYIEKMIDNYTSFNIVEGNINESSEPDNNLLKDALNSSDLLMWIGGNIQDKVRNETFYDSFDEFKRVISYCNSINLKYGFISISINQLSEDRLATAKSIFNHSSFIFTRESGSYDFIKDLKTDCKRIETGTDINFSYNLTTLRLASEYITSLGVKNRDFVTLIVRTNLNTIDANNREEICNRISGIIKNFVTEHEIAFLILPSDLGEIEISRKLIYEPLKDELDDRIFFNDQLLTPNIVQPILDESRFVVSMDLNSLVLSYSVGTPGLYLSLPEFGNENILIKDLGLKDWSINLRDTDDTEINKKIAQIHKKYVNALVMVDGVRKQIVKKQDDMIQTAGKLLYSSKGRDKKTKKKKK